MSELGEFLDTVIEHLANRTTARERVGYHVAEAYRTREGPVPYGALRLPEKDAYSAGERALPPAEEMVLVAWYNNPAQLALAQHDTGFLYVRLGRRQGALQVHPNLARVRHAVLRTSGDVVAMGLLRLLEPGFRVFTRAALRTELHQHAKGAGVAAWEADAGAEEEEHIYALFRTARDPAWDAQGWDGPELTSQIEQFEADRRNRPVGNLGRTSPNPRILPLRSLLVCLKAPAQQ
jgi:hypothetical protein